MQRQLHFPLLFLLLACLASLTLANSQKTIFLAPPVLSFPSTYLHLPHLTLTPHNSTLRTVLPRTPPTDNAHSIGHTTWFSLCSLHSGQRYELRVNWAAIQPTEFKIHTYTPEQVASHPALAASLAEYLETQQQQPHDKTKSTAAAPASRLLLRIDAAADYYTTDARVMTEPQDVLVDLVLDPYVGNVVPRSLWPTIAYIAVLAVGGWFLSQSVWSWLVQVGRGGKEHVK